MILHRISYPIVNNGKNVTLYIEPVYLEISGKLYSKGIFNIATNNGDKGDIVFNDAMDIWEYTGMNEFSREEVGGIAKFIQYNEKYA